MKKDIFLFDSDKLKEESTNLYDLEYTFDINFQLVNREFDKIKHQKMWVEFILEPLNPSKKNF
jgi:hypothetical protein